MKYLSGIELSGRFLFLAIWNNKKRMLPPTTHTRQAGLCAPPACMQIVLSKQKRKKDSLTNKNGQI